jgi:hypothetical protein
MSCVLLLLSLNFVVQGVYIEGISMLPVTRQDPEQVTAMWTALAALPRLRKMLLRFCTGPASLPAPFFSIRCPS